MTDWERDFIASHRLAHLATVGEDGQPHAVPIVYAFDGRHLSTPIDAKPKRVAASKLQRVRNLRANERVAVIIDDYDEDWQKLAWVQIRGWASLHDEGEIYQSGVDLLLQKYPQYAAMPLQDRPLIVVTPGTVVSWRATPDKA